MTKSVREEVAWSLGGDAVHTKKPTHSKDTTQTLLAGNAAKVGQLQQDASCTVKETGKDCVSSSGKSKPALQEPKPDSDGAKQTLLKPVPCEVVVSVESNGTQCTTPASNEPKN
eukprot:scaffold9589_cov99-Amphora_coffeaeformis.AAC.1